MIKAMPMILDIVDAIKNINSIYKSRNPITNLHIFFSSHAYFYSHYLLKIEDPHLCGVLYCLLFYF